MKATERLKIIRKKLDELGVYVPAQMGIIDNSGAPQMVATAHAARETSAGNIVTVTQVVTYQDKLNNRELAQDSLAEAEIMALTRAFPKLSWDNWSELVRSDQVAEGASSERRTSNEIDPAEYEPYETHPDDYNQEEPSHGSHEPKEASGDKANEPTSSETSEVNPSVANLLRQIWPKVKTAYSGDEDAAKQAMIEYCKEEYGIDLINERHRLNERQAGEMKLWAEGLVVRMAKARYQSGRKLAGGDEFDPNRRVAPKTNLPQANPKSQVKADNESLGLDERIEDIYLIDLPEAAYPEAEKIMLEAGYFHRVGDGTKVEMRPAGDISDSIRQEVFAKLNQLKRRIESGIN
jgi:hypothetical protein